MSSDPASPPQPPRGVTAIMVAGTVLVLLGLVAQLTANHALHEGSNGIRLILTVLGQFLMGAGGICMIAGAWRLWQWKKTALPRRPGVHRRGVPLSAPSRRVCGRGCDLAG